MFTRSILPAGSLRWDRLVRSSLASSIAGFIKGGMEELLSSCSAASVVSTVRDYSMISDWAE